MNIHTYTHIDINIMMILVYYLFTHRLQIGLMEIIDWLKLIEINDLHDSRYIYVLRTHECKMVILNLKMFVWIWTLMSDVSVFSMSFLTLMSCIIIIVLGELKEIQPYRGRFVRMICIFIIAATFLTLLSHLMTTFVHTIHT